MTQEAEGEGKWEKVEGKGEFKRSGRMDRGRKPREEGRKGNGKIGRQGHSANKMPSSVHGWR